jgi:hypothetical protein
MYERLSHQVLPRRQFFQRVVFQLLLLFFAILAALFLGVIGYRTFVGLDWIDALHNAAMILGGMGPVDRVETTAGKLFTSFYAIFCGLFLLTATSFMVAPFFHRLLHQFHLPKE